MVPPRPAPAQSSGCCGHAGGYRRVPRLHLFCYACRGLGPTHECRHCGCRFCGKCMFWPGVCFMCEFERRMPRREDHSAGQTSQLTGGRPGAMGTSRKRQPLGIPASQRGDNHRGGKAPYPLGPRVLNSGRAGTRQPCEASSPPLAVLSKAHATADSEECRRVRTRRRCPEVYTAEGKQD